MPGIGGGSGGGGGGGPNRGGGGPNRDGGAGRGGGPGPQSFRRPQLAMQPATPPAAPAAPTPSPFVPPTPQLPGPVNPPLLGQGALGQGADIFQQYPALLRLLQGSVGGGGGFQTPNLYVPQTYQQSPFFGG